jgi:hypothetical protein
MASREEGGVMDVVLVGCGAQKGKAAAPARELYTSALFRLSLRYAESIATAVYIVSAKHGLLTLDAEVEPYEFKLSDHGGKRALDAWGERVVFLLEARHRGAPLRVTLLMGDEYARPLRGPMVLRQSEAYSGTRWPGRPVEPLAGIQPVGRRMAWLKEQLEKGRPS